MLALSFGLSAAFIWAVHDLLVRKLSQGIAILPLILLVLISGAVVLVAPAVMFGDWVVLRGAALALSLIGGLAFAMAMGGLYMAFSLAPVRIVAPIIGAYPMLTLGIATAQGRAVTSAEWLAVVLIVLGIAVVAMTGGAVREGTATPRHLSAMGWAFLSAAGFAATFAIGQEAARQSSELPVILVTRMAALACIVGLYLWLRKPGQRLRTSWRGNWAVIVFMGAIDAVAIGLVTASGNLPNAEYASVTSALFGVLTVMLAAWFLREMVRPVQWMGIALVFTGVGILSVQG